MPLDAARWQIDLLAADKTASAFKSVETRMKSLDTQSKSAGSAMSAGFAGVTRMLGPLAAAFTAAAIAQKVWSAGMIAANLGEQAEQIGLTTDALQAYRLAAAQNGVESAQLDTAFMRLTKSMGEAAGGSDDAIARFEKLGVKLLDNNGNLRRTSDILPEVARGLLEIGNQAQRDALMMELFGRGGARMVTMLEAFSGGQAKLTAEAREMAAIMGVDVIAAWDKLDGQLKVVNQQMTVFQATVGAPLALGGLQALEWTLRLIADGYRGAKNAAIDFGLAIGSSVRGVNIKVLESDIAQIEKNIANPPLFMRGGLETMKQQLAEKKAILDKAKADEADYLRGAQENVLNRQIPIPFEPPPVTFRDFGLTGKQPTGNSARKAGEKSAADAIRESQRQMDELVALIEKQRKAADAIEDRFGTGAETLARETAELAEIQHLLAPETVQRAMKDLTDKADDQARAVRGAAGGFDGYLAGIEQAVAEMDRANSAFEYGKQTVDLMADALTELATTGEINFQKLLSSFVNMIIQMEMRAAASNVWGALGGAGGLLGLLGIGGVSSSAPLSFGAGGSGMAGAAALPMGWAPGFASGGTPPVGRPYVVGENGPEIRVDGTPGTIFNREQIAGMGGGGTSIVIKQTVHVGEYVTTEQYTAGIRAVKKAAEDGAQAALINRKKRGGLTDVF